MWLFLTLLTALLTSFSDVAGRKALERVDVYVTAWAWPFFCFICLLPFSLAHGVPHLGAAFFPAIITSGLILTVSSVFYAKAMKHSDLSLVMPMLTLTPVFLLFTSPWMLGEFPRPVALAGIVFIVIGSYILNVRDLRHGFWAPFASLFFRKGPQYMLAVAFLYSMGANVDKVGVENSSPLFWTMVVNGVVAVPLSFFLFLKVQRPLVAIRRQAPFLFLMGLFGAGANLSQMAAITLTLVPYLIAVKRMSVVFTSLFGFWLFKEKGWPERCLGVILMVTGVFIIAIFE